MTRFAATDGDRTDPEVPERDASPGRPVARTGHRRATSVRGMRTPGYVGLALTLLATLLL